MVQFGAIIFCRTILVSSGGLKKTLTKSHDYSRLFSKEKRRLKKKKRTKDPRCLVEDAWDSNDMTTLTGPCDYS